MKNRIKIMIGLFFLFPIVLFGQFIIEEKGVVREDGILEWTYNVPVSGVAIYRWMPSSDPLFQRDKIVVELRHDVRLEFFSERNVAFMDLYLFDNWQLYHQVKTPIPFDRSLQTSPDLLLKSLEAFVDWNLVLPTCDRSSYRQIEEVVHLIRSRLPRMLAERKTHQKEGVDSALFAKWVIDGFYAPRTGEEIPIPFLTSKPYEKRGGRHVLVWEDEEDPFFCLDWARNLALAVDLLNDKKSEYGDSDVNYLRELKYHSNTGYPIEELKKALYLLAIQEKEFFFIGSISKIVEKDVDLVKHTGMALFFPRINLEGEFEVIIFQDGKELSLESFIKENEQSSLLLVGFNYNNLFKPNKYETFSILRR